MYANLPVPVGQTLDGQGVVKVLGIGGVDGECGHTAHVAAASHFLVGDARLQAIGNALYVFGVLIGQTELSEDGVYLGIVLACFSQHVDHLADGAVGILWPLNDACHHLLAGLPATQLVQWDENVGGKEFAVYYQVGKIFLDLQGADKHLLFALKDLEHLGLRLQTHTCRADVYLNAVAVQGVHRVALSHVDGLAVLGTNVHAVLAVAAADEGALGDHRTAGGTIAADALLDDKAVNGKLFQDFDDDGTVFGRLGAHGSTHLLVVERCTVLFVKEGYHAVLVLTALLLERIQFISFSHNNLDKLGCVSAVLEQA